MSNPRSSRTDAAYSARFSRCKAGLPTNGFAAVALSILNSRDAAQFRTVVLSGLGLRGGGINPARSLRIAFSTRSELRSGCARSTEFHEKSPDFFESL